MKQIRLWEDESEQELPHHYIEVHYLDGRRRILDMANPEDAEAFRDMSIMYAGFVKQVSGGANGLPIPTASIVDNEAVDSIT